MHVGLGLQLHVDAGVHHGLSLSQFSVRYHGVLDSKRFIHVFLAPWLPLIKGGGGRANNQPAPIKSFV